MTSLGSRRSHAGARANAAHAAASTFHFVRGRSLGSAARRGAVGPLGTSPRGCMNSSLLRRRSAACRAKSAQSALAPRVLERKSQCMRSCAARLRRARGGPTRNGRAAPRNQSAPRALDEQSARCTEKARSAALVAAPRRGVRVRRPASAEVAPMHVSRRLQDARS